MKLSDDIQKVLDGQFVIKSPMNEKPFAITDATPQEWGSKNKVVAIDLGNGRLRMIGLTVLLMVLKEFYGATMLMEIITKLEQYDDVKDTVIEDHGIKQEEGGISHDTDKNI